MSSTLEINIRFARLQTNWSVQVVQTDLRPYRVPRPIAGAARGEFFDLLRVIGCVTGFFDGASSSSKTNERELTVAGYRKSLCFEL
jgi:hypothetical protein